MSVLDDFTQYHLRADSPCKESNGRLLFQSKNNFGPLLSPVVTPRIADFGLAQEVDDGANPFIHPIQPDHYRAPEVIVGGSWDYSADIWNFGAMVMPRTLSLFPRLKKPST
jgi:serine/threonine protein kinase